jgi:hypothetical protein
MPDGFSEVGTFHYATRCFLLRLSSSRPQFAFDTAHRIISSRSLRNDTGTAYRASNWRKLMRRVHSPECRMDRLKACRPRLDFWNETCGADPIIRILDVNPNDVLARRQLDIRNINAARLHE